MVQKHFYGEYGIQASLEFHGHLNMETKMIRDPRSLWWYDEMPQVLDANNQSPHRLLRIRHIRIQAAFGLRPKNAPSLARASLSMPP